MFSYTYVEIIFVNMGRLHYTDKPFPTTSLYEFPLQINDKKIGKEYIEG